MNREKIIFVLTLIIILVFTSGCARKEGPAPGTAPGTEDESGEAAQNTTFAVTTTLAVQGEIKDYLQLNGDVSARSSVDVYADTAGKLKNIYVKIGDTVQKDQIIAEVDPSRPGMTFASSPVKASISGTVTQVPVQVGSVIAPSLPIAKISKMDELEVVIYVAERFISKMRPGLPAIIRTEAYPGEIFRGSIRELSPVVDPVSRTMEVKLKLTDGRQKLKAGMFATIKLITEQKEGIVKIPAEALINRFGEDYVFVIGGEGSSDSGKKAEKRHVVPGLRIDNQLEIISGLAGGDEIVVRGQTLLDEGSSVKVVSSITPLDSADVVE